jgi:hypothetical protein
MDTRKISEEYALIGNDLIQTEEALAHIRNSNVSIVYLTSEHKKTGNGKIIHAQCEKIAEKYKWGIPADFTITVFEPNVEGMTEEQLRILIFHELLHVGIDVSEDGDESYSCVPHDLEDFKLIIDRYGTDWDRVDDGLTLNDAEYTLNE